MQNGLYKVEFKTPLGIGAGVVFLRDGKVHGGDSAMFYVGQLSGADENLTAEVEGKYHTTGTGVGNVFGPTIQHTHISLKGNGSGTAASFNGTAKEAPGVPFQATLKKISD